METTCERTCYLVVQKLGRTKKVIKVGKISDKYDILPVEEKSVALIRNNIKRRLEMKKWQRELEAIWLKAVKMQIKKRIEKEK